MKNIIKSSKGFTLIELLVVIAIIAILAVAVILTLNPAELLKQARDSTRVSDLSTLKSAISLYLADVSSPGTSSTCMISLATSSSGLCDDRYNASSGVQAVLQADSPNGVFRVDGTGWIPVNFAQISSGAPIGNLPRDPTNASTTSGRFFYSYKGVSTSSVFELNALVESAKYSIGGTSDVAGTDGGNQNATSSLYEVGTSLVL